MTKTPRQPQTGIPYLPRLVRLLLSRDWTSSNQRHYQNPYHKPNRPTDKVNRLGRKIGVNQLDHNLYKLMKWRSSLLSDTRLTFSDSRMVNKPCTNIPGGPYWPSIGPTRITTWLRPATHYFGLWLPKCCGTDAFPAFKIHGFIDWGYSSISGPHWSLAAAARIPIGRIRGEGILWNSDKYRRCGGQINCMDNGLHFTELA